MKNNKNIPIGVVCGALVVCTAAYAGIRDYTSRTAENAVTVQAADTADVKKTTESATADTKETTAAGKTTEKAVAKTAEKAVSETTGKTDGDSGMIYLNADAEGNLKEEDTNADAPVAVKVSYYLEGKQMTPEEIAGKSGKVKIRFDYENLVSKTVEADGQQVTVKAPFLVISAVMLPTDTFSNVSVSNGKVMEDDDQSIAVGMAFPGLYESLLLGNLDATKDIDLPGFVEITADAAEFELDFTASVASPVGFGEMDSTDFDDIDQMMDSMDELGDASDKLVAGTGTLLSGIQTFQTAMTAYTGGVDQLNSGIQTINASLAEVSMPDADSMSSVTSAASALTTDAAALGQEMEKLQGSFAGLQTFAQNVGAYKMAVDSALNGAASALENAQTAVENADLAATQQAQEQAESVLEAAMDANPDLTEEEKQAVRDAADYSAVTVTGAAGDASADIAEAQSQLAAVPEMDIPDLTVDLSGLTATLADMETQLNVLVGFSAGMSGLNDGVDTLTTALQQMEAGAGQLAENNSQVTSGLQALVDGTSSLYTGMQTFDKEGIQKLRELAGEDQQNLIRRVKAVREAEIQYKGKEDGAAQKNCVIETDAVEKK